MMFAGIMGHRLPATPTMREFKNDTFGNTVPYKFLGTANYVKHNGFKSMNVTWRLNKPIPAKYLKKTNKLVVG